MSIGVSSTNDLFHDHHFITNFFLSLHPHNTMSDTGRQSLTDKAAAALKVRVPQAASSLETSDANDHTARLGEVDDRAHGRQVQGQVRLCRVDVGAAEREVDVAADRRRVQLQLK